MLWQVDCIVCLQFELFGMMYVTKLSLGRFDFDHRYTCPFWKDSSSVVPIVQLKLDGLATSLMHQWSVQGDEIGRGRFWGGLVT